MSCHRVSRNKHIIWSWISPIASPEQKKNTRGARVHAAINMSKSFFLAQLIWVTIMWPWGKCVVFKYAHFWLNDYDVCLSAWSKKQVLHAEVIHLHLLFYSRPSLSLHHICISPKAFRVYYAQGSRCWTMFYLSDIWAQTLQGKEERENYAAFRRTICHHPFYFSISWLFGWPSPLCLFVCLVFLLPCAKRRWNHFVLQRVGKIPTANILRLSLSMIAKRSSAIFAAGQTRQAKASGNESLLDVWLPVEMGKMWGDEMLCSLQTRCSTKTPLIFTFPPEKRKYIFITACKPWQCTYG